MTEKSFLKKLINKYSKKFDSSQLKGLNLRMKAKEDLVLECDDFIKEEMEEIIPNVNYEDDDYIGYYKAKVILDEYFKRKEKIYTESLLRMQKPKGHEGYNLED
jgi:hypothetical protein